MKIEELTFPTTPELFTAHQEQCIGRTLTDVEKEIDAIWVTVFNDSYEDGKAQDKQALWESVDRMDQFIAEYGKEELIGLFLKRAKRWIIYAWEQGRKTAKEAVAI